VALKLLKEELMYNEQMIDRFKYEIKLAPKISHPNVMRIYTIVAFPKNIC
jgi:serine/threonine protein kinase